MRVCYLKKFGLKPLCNRDPLKYDKEWCDQICIVERPLLELCKHKFEWDNMEGGNPPQWLLW